MDFIPPSAFGYETKKNNSDDPLNQVLIENAQPSSAASNVQNGPTYEDTPRIHRAYNKSPKNLDSRILNPSAPISDKELRRDSTLAGITSHLHPGSIAQETGITTSTEAGEMVWKEGNPDGSSTTSAKKIGLSFYRKGNMGGFQSNNGSLKSCNG